MRFEFAAIRNTIIFLFILNRLILVLFKKQNCKFKINFFQFEYLRFLSLFFAILIICLLFQSTQHEKKLWNSLKIER